MYLLLIRIIFFLFAFFHDVAEYEHFGHLLEDGSILY